MAIWYGAVKHIESFLIAPWNDFPPRPAIFELHRKIDVSLSVQSVGFGSGKRCEFLLWRIHWCSAERRVVWVALAYLRLNKRCNFLKTYVSVLAAKPLKVVWMNCKIFAESPG